MRAEGLFESDAGGGVDGDAGDGGVGAVDEDEDGGGGAALEIAGVVVGDADGDAGAAGAHGGVHSGLLGLGEVEMRKMSEAAKALDEAAALLGVGLVEDYGGDLADVGVDCEAEEEELEDGDEEREEERGGVAEDVGELFAGYGAKAEEGRPARTAILRRWRSFADGGAARTARVGLWWRSSFLLGHDVVGEGYEDVF